MKNLLTALLFVGVFCISYAQEASVEKSIFNIQTGTFGVYINNESRLSDQLTIRGEIGFDAVFVDAYSTEQEIDKLAFTPVITVEPRWYYNIRKRDWHGKNIGNNSANFLYLKASYNPDLFLIPNPDDTNFISDILLLTGWGIRRSLGKNFNYELGAGIGYIKYLEDIPWYFTDHDNSVYIDLKIRIGYNF